VVVILLVVVILAEAVKPAPMSYSAFLDQFEAGNVASITFQGTEIDGRFKHAVDSAIPTGTAQRDTFSSRVQDVGDPTLIPALRKEQVSIDVTAPSLWTSLLGNLPWPMLLILGAILVAGLVRLVRGRKTPSGSAMSMPPMPGMMGLVSGLVGKQQQAAPPRKPTFTFTRTLESALQIYGFSTLPNRKQLITRYRELSKQHHPDVGGLHEDMVAINLAYDYLKRFVR